MDFSTLFVCQNVTIFKQETKKMQKLLSRISKNIKNIAKLFIEYTNKLEEVIWAYGLTNLDVKFSVFKLIRNANRSNLYFSLGRTISI